MGVAFLNYINRDIPGTQDLASIKVISVDNASEKINREKDLKKFDAFIEKPISIIGKINDIKKHNSNYSIILSSENEKLNIICKMQKDQIHRINNLKTGDKITIKGIYKGYLIDMILLNCIIINN